MVFSKASSCTFVPDSEKGSVEVSIMSFSQKLWFLLITPVPSVKHLQIGSSELDCENSALSVVLLLGQLLISGTVACSVPSDYCCNYVFTDLCCLQTTHRSKTEKVVMVTVHDIMMFIQLAWLGVTGVFSLVSRITGFLTWVWVIMGVFTSGPLIFCMHFDCIFSIGFLKI